MLSCAVCLSGASTPAAPALTDCRFVEKIVVVIPLFRDDPVADCVDEPVVAEGGFCSVQIEYLGIVNWTHVCTLSRLWPVARLQTGERRNRDASRNCSDHRDGIVTRERLVEPECTARDIRSEN